MAGDFQGFALEKAELLSGRLKEVLTTGQEYVQSHFGVDLGLKPESYPTWVILSTAAAGLLLLLGLSWAAVCGGLLLGKKRGCPVTQQSCEPLKTNPIKILKPEEPKKRNKKKTVEKKTQSNGQPVAVAQQEVKVTETISKQAPQVRTEKVKEVQAPLQVKKNKKKAKADVKPVRHLPINDVKETDDGAWETKVSNREKKQQRRKDKGSEDSGSPGGLEAPKTNGEAPVATAPTSSKRNRGNHESLHSRKGETAGGAGKNLSSSWKEEPSVNGGGWTNVSMKIPGQMGATEGAKWSSVHTATHFRAGPKRQSWAKETQAAWSGIDGQMKTDHNPVSFSILGRNTMDAKSHPVELQWVNQPDADDQWSGFNGTAAVDPSSDWNAPVEHWGNYEEVVMTLAPPQKEQRVTNKVLEHEKEIEDPSDGAAKSKRKRKKKKKTEEDAASGAQTMNAKLQELPVLTSKKQNSSISPSQNKPEPAPEPVKVSQKKKVRRET
ncbi:metadherin a isoform X2 [Antennarius striatus]|uniref:metadherin a isoform X2 n=1 Tax=Antennarius striatus TaxID=241820 RepID=UPI0035B28455